ncbi:MAG: metallophosphoesterase [Xanthomonadaceae bacterium]|nr:metallophosphoesterase [Xanthomonadaceae bacterium]
MGWHFNLKYANFVAYVTKQPPKVAPRATLWELKEFLGSIQGRYRDPNRPALISSSPEWIKQVEDAAERASDRARSIDAADEKFLGTDVIAEILDEFGSLLCDYDLFALAVGTSDKHRGVRAQAEFLAVRSKHHALFLIPDFSSTDDSLEIYDPLPLASTLATHRELWPGIVFWTPRGVTAFAQVDEVDDLFRRIQGAFVRGAGHLDWVLNDFNDRKQRSAAKRIIHLSDLHFGATSALENQAYLLSHLRSVLTAHDRVVITGDLFDNPKREDALAFRNFRSELAAASGHEPILVPGNHDQKLLGNSLFGIGSRLNEVAKLEWSSLVIDSELECVFYCFDSSRDADFARGRVTKQQLMEVATEFEVKANGKPEIRNYLGAALVHHHPFSFETQRETKIQRFLAKAGFSDEAFLRMEEAEGFLAWCAGRRVPLILHGHKHVPRHVKQSVNWQAGARSEWRDVTAVGCGTSLGAEGYPLSYNIVHWSAASRSWAASFYSDPGTGTGFEEQYVAMHTVGAPDAISA